jgi:hypothetical protein
MKYVSARTTIVALAVTLTSLALVAGSASAGTNSGFSDVPDDDKFAGSIAWLRTADVTRGCNPPFNTEFCPSAPVTRGQMAAFLSRALHLDAATTVDRFNDDDDSRFAADIDRLAEADIARGCNPPANDRFCPDRRVTRGEMAAFLARGFALPAAGGESPFTDAADTVFADSINRVAAADITLGCNPPANDRFCPDDFVTREQLAAFLWRAHNRPDPGQPTRIVAAGDIARCELSTDEQTAALLDEMFANTNGAVAALGDTVYNDGSPEQYRECYQPSWGRHRFRTYPAVGNHEYRTENASGYFDYFGPVAGDPTEGWYSYELAGWQVIVLNSNCSEIGGCDAGSPQELWLRQQLADSPAACTLAYMHHPRFSSGSHGDNEYLTELWSVLVEYDVELALAGHDHNYERFAPMTADGVATATGVQSFVVGTGGTWLRAAGTARDGSDVLIDDKHGVLVLDLSPEAYEWRFVASDGEVLDAGTRSCTP